MLISELSRQTGVSIHTLRYYENRGLITGKSNEAVTSNKYKQYDAGCAERINWIVAAKQAGFTLAEIKELLRDWFDGRLTVGEKLRVGEQKIREVDRKIEQLREVKRFLLETQREVENGRC